MVRIGSTGQYLDLTAADSTDGVVTATLLGTGLRASLDVQPHPARDGFGDLIDYFTELENKWRGWRGTRSWTSLEGELQLSAVHSGSHVQLHVSLRRETFDDTDWTLRMSLTLDAGEELSTAAATIRAEMARGTRA